MTPNFAPKRAIVLLGKTFNRIDFRIDLLNHFTLIPVNLIRCPAARVSVLTLPARVLHYDGTISALVQILIDFLKALRFHQNQSILAALQPEYRVPLPRGPLSSAIQQIFTPYTTSASRWTLAKLLLCQSILPRIQSMQVTPHTTHASRWTLAIWPPLSCSQIDLLRRKW